MSLQRYIYLEHAEKGWVRNRQGGDLYCTVLYIRVIRSTVVTYLYCLLACAFTALSPKQIQENNVSPRHVILQYTFVHSAIITGANATKPPTVNSFEAGVRYDTRPPTRWAISPSSTFSSSITYGAPAHPHAAQTDRQLLEIPRLQSKKLKLTRLPTSTFSSTLNWQPSTTRWKSRRAPGSTSK